jgi:hypothetical protein
MRDALKEQTHRPDTKWLLSTPETAKFSGLYDALGTGVPQVRGHDRGWRSYPLTAKLNYP